MSKPRVRLTVGLDFGTSTVKCIVRERREGRRNDDLFVVSIDGQNLFPSLAWVCGDVLAVRKPDRPSARTVRSVKACIRCGVLKDEPCRRCFEGLDIDAETVAWAILSYCVDYVRTRLRDTYSADRYGVDWARDVEWNMGVPLDGLEQEPLRSLFQNLLWRAVHFGSEAGDGSFRLPALSRRYRSLGDKRYPGEAEADCFVFPESHVAVNAFLHSQRSLEDGLYCICDVGAGTTDIAFFRFVGRPVGGQRPVVFYSASCTRVGGDDFEALRCVDGSARGAGQDQRFLALYKKIEKGRTVAFGRAFEKEKTFSRWKRDFRGLVMMGGGAKIAGVAESCSRSLTAGAESIRPDRLPFSVQGIAEIGNATDLHGIAFGLSIPAAEYYNCWRHDEVEPFIPKKRVFEPFPFGNPYVGR